MNQEALLLRYRQVLGLFIVGLVLSGITAFPLLHELRWMASWLGVNDHAAFAQHQGMAFWIGKVWHGLEVAHAEFPFIAYGTDWLAFAHLVIALFFVEPWRHPLGNVWVLKVGLVACAGIIPLAFIAGAVRGIPVCWRLIDCSFGVIGALPLLYCLHLARRMSTGASA